MCSTASWRSGTKRFLKNKVTHGGHSPVYLCVLKPVCSWIYLEKLTVCASLAIMMTVHSLTLRPFSHSLLKIYMFSGIAENNILTTSYAPPPNGVRLCWVVTSSCLCVTQHVWKQPLSLHLQKLKFVHRKRATARLAECLQGGLWAPHGFHASSWIVNVLIRPGDASPNSSMINMSVALLSPPLCHCSCRRSRTRTADGGSGPWQAGWQHALQNKRLTSWVTEIAQQLKDHFYEWLAVVSPPPDLYLDREGFVFSTSASLCQFMIPFFFFFF